MDELCHMVDEKNKLLIMSRYNIETHSKIKKMIQIIDQIESGLSQRSETHIKHLSDLDQSIQENINLFKSICSNLMQ